MGYWTTDLPTKAGYYWTRFGPEDRWPDLAYIDAHGYAAEFGIAANTSAAGWEVCHEDPEHIESEAWRGMEWYSEPAMPPPPDTIIPERP